MQLIGYLRKKQATLDTKTFYNNVCTFRVVTNFACWPLGVKLELPLQKILDDIGTDLVNHEKYDTMLDMSHEGYSFFCTDCEESIRDAFFRFIALAKTNKTAAVIYNQGEVWKTPAPKAPSKTKKQPEARVVTSGDSINTTLGKRNSS